MSEELIFVGGNTGNAVLLNKDGETVSQECVSLYYFLPSPLLQLHTYHRFHKGKIQHAEFCPASENILVTSSNDKTVSIWDIRTWGEEHRSPLAVLKHEAPVNSGN